LQPGEPTPPEPLSEPAIAHLLATGQTTAEVITALRAKHAASVIEYELARNAWLLSRNGRNALDNDPVTGAPGPQLKALASDAIAQLRKDGFIR
jgi:hypothetical protein